MTSSQTNASILTIKVNGLPNNEGKLLIGIYNQKEGFRDMDKTFRNITLNAQKGSMNVLVDNIPDGDYAIAVYHDKNENGKLDKNFLGIPTEKYGFSNDAMGKMGPPTYEACLIKVKGNTEITINLK